MIKQESHLLFNTGTCILALCLLGGFLLLNIQILDFFPLKYQNVRMLHSFLRYINEKKMNVFPTFAVTEFHVI